MIIIIGTALMGTDDISVLGKITNTIPSSVTFSFYKYRPTKVSITRGIDQSSNKCK